MEEWDDDHEASEDDFRSVASLALTVAAALIASFLLLFLML